MAMSCKPTTIEEVLEMARDINQDIQEMNLKQSKLMKMLEEIVSKDKDAEMNKEITSVKKEEVKSIELSHRDDGKIFNSEDIRGKSRAIDEDKYEKKWLIAVEQEKQAYLEDIKAKIIRNVKVEFSLTDDGCVVGKATVDGKYVKDIPAAEDLVSLEGEGFSQKAKIINVTGFKEISIGLLFKCTFEFPEEEKFVLRFVPMILTYKRMIEAVLNLNGDMEEILTGQYKSEKRQVSQDIVTYYMLFCRNRSIEKGSGALNKSQSIAIKTSLEETLSLIVGPPGTGKTTTIASLVWNLCEDGKVLVTAPSNFACDNLVLAIARFGLDVRSYLN